MTLLRLLKLIAFVCVLQFIGFANVFANNTSQYAAVIYFPSNETAQWMVYHAYSSLAKIDEKIDKLTHSTIEALDYSKSPSDRYYLDLKFQTHKHDLDGVINQGTTWFDAFNDEITIEINDDGYGNHRVFNLPIMRIVDLGIVSDDLTSVENAKSAIAHVNAARDKIKSILTIGVQDATQTNLVNTKSNNLSDKNKFYVASSKDSQAILNSLNNINDFFMREFDQMLKIATDAATGTHTQQEMLYLDAGFQMWISDLASTMDKGFSVGNIKTFNDNRLTFQLAGNSRTYHFTKLNLDAFDLKNDHITTLDSAYIAFDKLIRAKYWVRDWTVTGTSPVEPIKIKLGLNELGWLNLTDKERVILQKMNGDSVK